MKSYHIFLGLLSMVLSLSLFGMHNGQGNQFWDAHWNAYWQSHYKTQSQQQQQQWQQQNAREQYDAEQKQEFNKILAVLSTKFDEFKQYRAQNNQRHKDEIAMWNKALSLLEIGVPISTINAFSQENIVMLALRYEHIGVVEKLLQNFPDEVCLYQNVNKKDTFDIAQAIPWNAQDKARANTCIQTLKTKKQNAQNAADWQRFQNNCFVYGTLGTLVGVPTIIALIAWYRNYCDRKEAQEEQKKLHQKDKNVQQDGAQKKSEQDKVQKVQASGRRSQS
jgi:hypothetical protein